MPYDLSNLASVTNYLNQMRAGGMYTPTNGSMNTPSAGWDGWQGYNPLLAAGSNGDPTAHTAPVPMNSGGPSSFQPPATTGQFNVQNGVMMNTQSGQGWNPGGRDDQVGASGYSTHDVFNMAHNPMTAMNTPFASYMRGGNGNGPTSFQRGPAMAALQAMNAGIDPSSIDAQGGLLRRQVAQMTHADPRLAGLQAKAMRQPQPQMGIAAQPGMPIYRNRTF